MKRDQVLLKCDLKLLYPYHNAYHIYFLEHCFKMILLYEKRSEPCKNDSLQC